MESNRKVLVVQKIDQAGMDMLEEGGWEVITPPDATEETVIQYVRDCEAIIVRGASITEKIMEHAPKLKIIVRHGVGLDKIDLAAAARKDIIVRNTPYANVNAVAELVVGFIISLSRNITGIDQELRNGNFAIRDSFIGDEIINKTIGIIGFGNIGRLVAQKCTNGLGMNALVYDVHLNKDELEDNVQIAETLDELIENSDYISLHLPYLKELHHFVGRDFLSKMKASAYLINCARGGLVDESALKWALESGVIKGAAFDVFEDEPISKGHPLLGLDNIIVSPHMGANTVEAKKNMATSAAKELLKPYDNA